MTPSDASVTDPQGRGAANAPAVLSCPAPCQTLQKRADFLRAASALRQKATGFMLQARKRAETELVSPDIIRIGFTCSKKVGNAVTRNRAKRRLRALARMILPNLGQAGWDYVLIGRSGVTTERDFKDLQADLTNALRVIHAEKKPKPPRT